MQVSAKYQPPLARRSHFTDSTYFILTRSILSYLIYLIPSLIARPRSGKTPTWPTLRTWPWTTRIMHTASGSRALNQPDLIAPADQQAETQGTRWVGLEAPDSTICVTTIIG